MTLVELLTVITILIVLIGVGAWHLKPMASGSISQAAATIGGLFDMARSAAVIRGVETAVRVHCDPKDQERCFRYLIVVYRDSGTGTWKALDQGVYLPPHIYFNPPRSEALPGGLPTEVTWAFPESGEARAWVSYPFDRYGNLAAPQAQVVINRGHIGSGDAMPRFNPKDLAGFWINRFGAQHYFHSEDEMFVDEGDS